jgi:hypothetical protein
MFTFPLSSIAFCLARMAQLLEPILHRHSVSPNVYLLLPSSIGVSLRDDFRAAVNKFDLNERLRPCPLPPGGAGKPLPPGGGGGPPGTPGGIGGAGAPGGGGGHLLLRVL